MAVTRGLTNPRTQIDRGQGSGLFNPKDREFQKIRLKAQAVLEGRATFTYDELGRILARLLTEI